MDIKPANVLIDRYGRTKLADFGMSRLLKDQLLVEEQGGSMVFMAPEIKRGQRYDPFKADIWALGITFYYICMGRAPWPLIDMKQLKEAINKGIEYMPETMPHDMKALISAMCSLEPSSRPTAQSLTTMAMFRGLEPKDGYLPIEKARPQKKAPSKKLSHAAKSTTNVGLLKGSPHARKSGHFSAMTMSTLDPPCALPLS